MKAVAGADPKLLAAALSAVNWNENVASFLAIESAGKRIHESMLILALWAKQLEVHEGGNPAICFVREMQANAHHIAALLALGLYKPAAAAIRAVLETALYFTYFRSHPVELATLVRDPKFYVSKQEILEFHRAHTRKYHQCQSALGLVSSLESSYSRLSAIAHGQVPGQWSNNVALKDTTTNNPLLLEAVTEFEQVVRLVSNLFLSTVARDFWGHVPPPVKERLLHSLPGDKRAALDLEG